MLSFSTDPGVAERQMNALIYYLTAFGYVDGEFEERERTFVRDHIKRLVEQRARDALGADLATYADTVARWQEHFLEVATEVDQSIADLFTESVSEGESSEQFVLAKIKLRCFELFQGFDSKNREGLLSAVDALMLADGVAHPNEQRFRNELFALLDAPVDASVDLHQEELDDTEIESVQPGAVIVGEPKALAPVALDHEFLRGLERDHADDKETFAEQVEDELALIHRVRELFAAQREKGKGRLAGAYDFSDFEGERFLDGHVYVHPPAPGKRHELIVLGDLHGCYSCLKAALLQSDFLHKAEAYHKNPDKEPNVTLVFLGDYIDRGRFSYAGTLRAALQLFAAAPDHVCVLRGNHEYYVELNGRVLAPVRPSEAMDRIARVAPKELIAEYMRLFEDLPNMLVFDRTLFVHAGIPREDTLAEKFKGLASLNDPEIRFQMLWSDPSEADNVPLELQKQTARFPFGRKQLKAFLERLGVTTMIRGHERVIEGFRKVYDDPEATLMTLFSAGGKGNLDLPPHSNYRDVTPMALSIVYENGVTQIHPFALDYAKFNDPEHNAFFKKG